MQTLKRCVRLSANLKPLRSTHWYVPIFFYLWRMPISVTLPERERLNHACALIGLTAALKMASVTSKFGFLLLPEYSFRKKKTFYFQMFNV